MKRPTSNQYFLICWVKAQFCIVTKHKVVALKYEVVMFYRIIYSAQVIYKKQVGPKFFI